MYSTFVCLFLLVVQLFPQTNTMLSLPSHSAYSSPSADPPEPILCHVSGPGHTAIHRHHTN